jgi:outer membrane immunogenic protein
MKSFSFVTTALAGGMAFALAGAAAAQPSDASSGTVNWSGVYVGLNTGWNSANTRADPGSATTQQLTGVSAGAAPVTVPPVTFPTRQMNYGTSGWAAGGQVGFNHQMGHIVLGLEGDMDAVNGHAFQASSYQLPATALTTSPGTTVDIERFTAPKWTSTVRGRVGWAMGRALIYGTGGLAIADVRQSAAYNYSPGVTPAVAAANPGTSFGGTSNFGDRDSILTGWTVGGGAEWALNRGVSVGAEYRHSDYGKSTYDFGGAGPGQTSEAARLGFTDDQVLAKVNFRFGPGGMF